jgi:imidazole glycerol-phosphate synthase subunit HisF
MLRSRIVPCLLIHNKGLVKTVKFKEGKYVGDPINAVRIFNEKEVDELMVLDIDATVNSVGPNFDLIRNLAVECRMPFCYGGGVSTVEQAMKIISLGAEKVALSAGVITNPQLVADIAKAVGSQSVIIVIDVKKKMFGGYEVYTHNGKKATSKNPTELAKQFEILGAGEIVINAIDQDGVMKGFDFSLFDSVRAAISCPMTILGGAGSLEDIKEAIKRYGTIGVAAGSLFVFKGVYKAVLINYPTKQERKQVLSMQ